MQFHRNLGRLPLLIFACVGLGIAAHASAVQGAVPGAAPIGQGAGARKQAEPTTAEELVRVTVGVVGEAKPGATVRVAATFTIHPGWHIYWVNPGDSGMPTQLTLDLPAGCAAARDAAGELQIDFPIPQVFSKGETTIGYERSVTLSTAVTLPKEIPAGGLPVTVRSRWLVCKQACLLGQNESRVDLAKPVAADAPLAKALAESLARTPAPAPAGWKCAIADVAADSAVLSIEAPGAAELRFLPYETPGARLASGLVADAKGGSLRAQLALSRESTLGKPLEVAGIVVVGKNGPAYSFRVPVPAAK